MSEPCPDCATRGHIYHRDCPQCQARMIARTPRKIAAAWFESWKAGRESVEVDTMRQAIVVERARDK